MDKTALVEQDIDQGRRLIQALDQAAFPVVAALWNYLPEERAWRLLIASPRVAELGPRRAYAAIQDVLGRSQIGIPLQHIAAVSPDEPLIADLRVFAGTDPAAFAGNPWLEGTVIGHTNIEAAYVYRAEPIIGQSGVLDLWSVVRDKSRKVWTARLCKITAENGFLKKIEVAGLDWPQRQAKLGVNAQLRVLTNTETRHGSTFGDVVRWNIHAGKLRSIETVAKGVRIEQLNPSTSLATPTT